MLKKNFLLIYNFFFNYPTPSNLTYLWNFGVISFIFFIIQFVSGFFLSMYYFPYDVLAFISVENIMREVTLGWIVRYIHSNGASFFFFFVFMHMFRNLYYFSFIKPRYQVWNIGVLIFLLMIVTAFTGYVLPWGQMSFRAATVTTNLFSAVPIFGNYITVWLWGAYPVSGATLNRFFSFHFILPFILLLLIIIHFLFLHEVGSSNNLKLIKNLDKIFFHPYYTFKDLLAIIFVLFVYLIFIGLMPNYLSHSDNYIPADALVTPAHIVPEWYFLLFHAMSRSIPSKLGGVIILFLSIIILFIFPLFINFFFFNNFWLNEKFYNFSIKKNLNFNFYLFKRIIINSNLFIWLFLFFLTIFVILSVIGSKPIEYPYLIIGRFFTFFYFFYFLFIIYYFLIINSIFFLINYLNFYKHINIYKLNLFKIFNNFENITKKISIFHKIKNNIKRRISGI